VGFEPTKGLTQQVSSLIRAYVPSQHLSFDNGTAAIDQARRPRLLVYFIHKVKNFMPFAVVHMLFPILLINFFKKLKFKFFRKISKRDLLVAGIGGILPDVDILISAFLSTFSSFLVKNNYLSLDACILNSFSFFSNISVAIKTISSGFKPEQLSTSKVILPLSSIL